MAHLANCSSFAPIDNLVLAFSSSVVIIVSLAALALRMLGSKLTSQNVSFGIGDIARNFKLSVSVRIALGAPDIGASGKTAGSSMLLGDVMLMLAVLAMSCR